MKEPIVLESNQNHATITSNGICPTLPASMVFSGAFLDRNSEHARTIGYRGEQSPTIRESVIPSVVICRDEENENADRKEVL